MHLQEIIWKTVGTKTLKSTELGGKDVSGRLNPIKAEKAPAPENVLNFIRCGYEPTFKRPCGGNTCFSSKNRLICVPACTSSWRELS